MIAALFGAAALAWIVEWTIGAAILLAALAIAIARGIRDFTRGVRRGYADPIPDTTSLPRSARHQCEHCHVPVTAVDVTTWTYAPCSHPAATITSQP